MYFLTDGKPFAGESDQDDEVWLPSRKAAIAACPKSVHILSFGFGSANEENLRAVATEHRGEPLAFIAESGMQVSSMLANLFDVILYSISASVERDDLVIRTPEGMRRAGVNR